MRHFLVRHGGGGPGSFFYSPKLKLKLKVKIKYKHSPQMIKPPWSANAGGNQKLQKLLQQLHSEPLPPVHHEEKWRLAAESAIEEIPLEQRKGTKIAFMLMDVAVIDDPAKYNLGGTDATVCMWGNDADGRSVHVTVRGFRPFVFLEFPLDAPARSASEYTDVLFKELRRVGAEKVFSSLVEGKPAYTKARRLCGFVPDWSPGAHMSRPFVYAKLEFLTTSNLRRFVSDMQRASRSGGARSWLTNIYENKVGAVHKFMDAVDTVHHLRPCGWAGIKSYKPVEESEKASHCEIEIECTMADVVALDITRVAPLLIASTDIECYSDKDEFPEPENEKDAVICIGTTLKRFGTFPERPGAVKYPTEPINIAHVLRECADCEDIQPIWFDDEDMLLSAWSLMISEYARADIIIGYNLLGFDYKYMAKRCRDEDHNFFSLGKLKYATTALKSSETSSTQAGYRETHALPMYGCVTIDVMNWIVGRFPKLTQHGLDFVANHFLNIGKIEFDYKAINDCFRKTPQDRSTVINYCRRDCELPLTLMERLKGFLELLQFSQVSITPLADLVSRGQQIRTFNMLVMFCHRQKPLGFIMNPVPPVPKGVGYAGAFVLDPEVGLHMNPIGTLDFASLYPSIMQAKNLCYTTWVPPRVRNLPAHVDKRAITYDVSDNGDLSETTRFVSAHVQKGILPKITEALLDERRATRRQMKKLNPSSEEHGILDGRQLALKVMCNCCYGFTGTASNGMYPLMELARTVTAVGRGMILRCREVAQGPLFKYKVVYGDTDSIMVDFGVNPDDPGAVEKAWGLGEKLASHITDLFARDGETMIVLENECVYFPYLLLKKKRYAARKFENEKDFSESSLAFKGIEIVRRDTSQLVRTTLQSILDDIMTRRSVDLAVATLSRAVEKIVNKQLTEDDVLLTKRLRSGYKTLDLPHVRVAEKMEKRAPGAAPRPGDRVLYIIYRGPSGSKLCDRAEDPEYARAHQLEFDRAQYLEDIRRPVKKMMDVVDINIEKIFDAAHAEVRRQDDKQSSISWCSMPKMWVAPRIKCDNTQTTTSQVPPKRQKTLQDFFKA